MATLHLELLGGLRVFLDGKPITGFYSIKVPALLAYLAVTQKAHTRDHLAALLWGEMPDADAKTNLRQALANLKKLLEPFLDIQRDAVELKRDANVRVDVWEFEKQITDSRWQIADSNSSSAISHLPSAIRQYRGDFLEGIFLRDAPAFEEWAIAERARLRELALDALQQLVAQFTARGEYANAIAYAQKLLALDAWREEAHRELMLLYARTNQRSAALAQYDACARMLREQLRVEPSAETNALYERLRAVGDIPKHNLPAQPTSFVGRAQELAQIETLLLNPDARLLTLVGVGGSGKTRLALHAAERVWKLGAFLNGVAFVALANVESIEQLAPTMANTFGITLTGDVEPQTQITDYLRAKEMLVVLDNLEQLLDAATWLGEILQNAPRVKLLVTSREKLNTRWEWIVPLQGLEYADADSPAAQLFVERAQRAAPNFRVDESNRADVARVCAFVEGMPLALELAAAAVNRHTCAEIANELERNLNFLETTLRDVPARQRSMRAVFDYSWQLLSERERALWRKLSVFQGGWTRDAARAIADASPNELNALADKSLVRVQTSRYDMHELARQYAREKLEQDADENSATRAKHSEFFAAYAAAHESALKGAGDQSALSALTQELANVLAGWELAWTIPNWDSIRAYMEPLFVILEMRGQFLLGAHMYASVGACVEGLRERSPEAEHVLGQLLIREGWMRFRLGEFSKTLELVQRGLPLLENARDEYEIAYAFLFLGAAEWGRGELEASEKFFLASYTRYEKIDNAWGCAGALNNLGQVATARGDDDAAENYLSRALQLARAANISHLTAHTLNNLALLAMRHADSKQAQKFLAEALDIANARGEPHLIALTQSHLARALAQDEPRRAQQVGEHALAMFREFGDRSNMLPLLTLLGNLAQAQNETSRAINYFREALTLANASGASAQTIAETESALAALQPS